MSGDDEEEVPGQQQEGHGDGVLQHGESNLAGADVPPVCIGPSSLTLYGVPWMQVSQPDPPGRALLARSALDRYHGPHPRYRSSR